MDFVAYAFQQCKKFENRLIFDKVTESLKVRTFLRHSVYYVAVKIESSRTWPWPRGALRPVDHVFGLGFGFQVLGIGLRSCSLNYNKVHLCSLKQSTYLLVMQMRSTFVH